MKLGITLSISTAVYVYHSEYGGEQLEYTFIIVNMEESNNSLTNAKFLDL